MRTHEIFPCARCRDVFNNLGDLQEHLQEDEPCVRKNKILDTDYDWSRGFDQEQLKKLKKKTRKRPLDEPGDVEKWRAWYKILFPIDQEIPSPCKLLFYLSFTSYHLMCQDYEESLADWGLHVEATLSQRLQPQLSAPIWESVMRTIRETIEELIHQEPNESQQFVSAVGSYSQQDVDAGPQLDTPFLPENHPGMGYLAMPDMEVPHLSSQPIEGFDMDSQIMPGGSEDRLLPGAGGNDTEDSSYYTSGDARPTMRNHFGYGYQLTSPELPIFGFEQQELMLPEHEARYSDVGHYDVDGNINDCDPDEN